jgi:hypothetical protein
MTATRSVPSSPTSKKLTGVAARRIHGDKGYRDQPVIGHLKDDHLKITVARLYFSSLCCDSGGGPFHGRATTHRGTSCEILI